MKRILIYGAGMMMWLASTTVAVAQNTLQSSYFLEGSSYRHRLNPAFAAERSYFSFPILGNLNLGTQGNVGVSNFLYPTSDGNLTTFMSPNVDKGGFLDGLKDRNRINLNMDLTVLSFGFRAFGGFNTIELNSRTAIKMNLPKDLFAFMKDGMATNGKEYVIDDMGMSANSYMELALGHSHRVNSRLTIGAKAKILLGLAQADVTMNNMRVRLSENLWEVRADAEMNVALKGFKLPTKGELGTADTPDQRDEIEWDETDFDTPGLSGGGLAFDLGATYQVLDDLEVSLAVLDFGFMRWNSAYKAVTPNTPWTFDGFHDIAIDPEPGSPGKDLDEQLEDLGDQLEDCMNFRMKERDSKRTTMLGATLNIGALYTFPYYRKLKLGFLSTTRINGRYSWSEGRFSANVAPVKVFDASINYAISSFGSSFGWLLNFHARGFNLFVGADHQIFKVTPQYVPVHNLNSSVSFGINFPLGKRSAL